MNRHARCCCFWEWVGVELHNSPPAHTAQEGCQRNSAARRGRVLWSYGSTKNFYWTVETWSSHNIPRGGEIRESVSEWVSNFVWFWLVVSCFLYNGLPLSDISCLSTVLTGRGREIFCVWRVCLPRKWQCRRGPDISCLFNNHITHHAQQQTTFFIFFFFLCFAYSQTTVFCPTTTIPTPEAPFLDMLSCIVSCPLDRCARSCSSRRLRPRDCPQGKPEARWGSGGQSSFLPLSFSVLSDNLHAGICRGIPQVLSCRWRNHRKGGGVSLPFSPLHTLRLLTSVVMLNACIVSVFRYVAVTTFHELGRALNVTL